MIVSDWKTIGTAGDTIDGRVIEDQDLIDAAETYDKDEYTAVINSDHELWWYGNFGHVEEVRLGKDKKDRVILEAKLAPNFRLIEKNRNGQGMFTSMELWPNFANSGKTYLSGLAVTDMPASLGTSMLQLFSRRKSNPEYNGSDNPKVMKEFLSLNFDELENPEPKPESDEKLLAKFARLFMKNQTTETEDEEMSKEQLEKLCQQNEQIVQSLSAIADGLKNVQPEAPASGGEPETPSAPAASDNPDITKLTASVEAMGETVTQLSDAFKKLLEERPGTTPKASEGAAEKEFV